jgi:hypothetical protein
MRKADLSPPWEPSHPPQTIRSDGIVSLSLAMRRRLATMLASVAGALLPVVLAIALAPSGTEPHADADDVRAAAAPAGAVVTVSGQSSGPAVPPGFVGVSMETSALEPYTGPDPRAVNPVLVALIRHLAPGSIPVIRIGGDSTDQTWWPVAGHRRPPGVTYSLSHHWLALARALAQATGGRLILGVNLEAGHRWLAVAEARALVHGIGTAHLLALEPGNEPSHYRLLPYFRNAAGRLVWARGAGYGLSSFERQFAATARLLPRGLSLAGPAFSGLQWMAGLPGFLRGEPRVRIVTEHRYPMNRCWTVPGTPTYPTLAGLLTPFAVRSGLAALAHYVALTHASGRLFRVDELNSVACGGKAGVSDRFASALWALDELFTLASAGVDGVNLHTFPGARYGLFSFRRTRTGWVTQVAPEYYGLLAFVDSAPAGARLLSVHIAGGGSALRAWATRTPDGVRRVVLINDDPHRARVVRLELAGPATQAVLSRLTAPAVAAARGIRLGGRSFSAATTGVLGRPQSAVVSADPGPGFVVSVGPASAALLTIRP